MDKTSDETLDDSIGLPSPMAQPVSSEQRDLPLVSIIVLNLDGQEYLERCFSSVLAQSYPRFEAILVDNASTDGSVELVKQRFPAVRIIQNAENLGFSTANNVAIKATASKYVVTLNNDTEVEPQWLEEMVKAIEAEPGVGMCAPKMLYHHQREIIDSAGIEVDLAGIGWNRRHGERDEGREAATVEVFGPCAGAALYRREMLDQIGLFDEDYFAYYEDVDLAWRARLAGWRCLHVPTARVYHVHSAYWQKKPAYKLYLMGRNKTWTILKNAPLPYLLYLPLILVYDLAAVLYHLLVGRETSPLRGRIAAMRGLAQVWRKRAEVQQKRAVSFVSLTRLMRLPKSPVSMVKEYRRGGEASD